MTLRTSDLVGQLTQDRIPRDRVTVVPAATGVVTIEVRPLFAKPDTYAGTLLSTDGQPVKNFLVAITELGVSLG